ncbi:hypothetical protein IMG5_001110 [Ichthyophthirius multifiliis]|uniref:Transmembrane protein n=1 Tax=Ichthyophthirius multifiliis TaxID=5932 RepID=G0QIQ2_ICHMU|nr:hypothetical protein IMG5_001110 [Ichthyophthirius multifiliis]EGR34882.1 hypothetical protein IMG5_001110 [Ichthyophthirius multifiliis]|eukprot:XP_004040186.1 hypothetical protein IMG5_001110 [Ichthyophthirius multifiliis]
MYSFTSQSFVNYFIYTQFFFRICVLINFYIYFQIYTHHSCLKNQSKQLLLTNLSKQEPKVYYIFQIKFKQSLAKLQQIFESLKNHIIFSIIIDMSNNRSIITKRITLQFIIIYIFLYKIYTLPCIHFSIILPKYRILKNNLSVCFCRLLFQFYIMHFYQYFFNQMACRTIPLLSQFPLFQNFFFYKQFYFRFENLFFIDISEIKSQNFLKN